MFSVSLRRAGEVRRYSVSACGAAGWEVKSETNRMPTRHVCYHDWHRVERMIAIFQLEIAGLQDEGWRVQSAHMRLLEQG